MLCGWQLCLGIGWRAAFYSADRGESWLFDCLKCGACCFGPQGYVVVRPSDVERLGTQLEHRYVVGKGERSLKMVHGRCAALHARQGHYSCRIYGVRPEPCRVVAVGSAECLTARRRIGLPTE